MTKIDALRAGFDKVHEQLIAALKTYEAELRENPENYEGFTADDAYVWFVEHLS